MPKIAKETPQPFPGLPSLTQPQKRMVGYIRRKGPTSRRDLGRYFCWSPAWTTVHLKPLLEMDEPIRLLTSEDPDHPRRSERLMIHPNALLAYGVHIGFDSVAIGLVNFAGEVVERGKVLWIKNEGIEHVAERIQQEIKRIGSVHPTRQVIGTGISFAGKLSKDASGELHRAPGAEQWNTALIHDLFSNLIGGHLEIHNDKDAAMLAELRYGQARNCDDAIFMYMDEGISLGLISNGRILSGHYQNSGEFGHICLNPDGPFCHCGARGCLESVASQWAIENQVEQLKNNGVSIRFSNTLGPAASTLDLLSNAALDGQLAATHVLRDAGMHIGKLLAITVNVLDPEKVILGGVLSNPSRHAVLVEAIQEYLFGSLSQLRLRPTVTHSLLGDDVGLIGGASLLFERHFPAYPPQLIPEGIDPLASDAAL